MDIDKPKDMAAMPDDDESKTAYWRQHVSAWRDADLSQREYTRQHGLSIARFTYWKNKFYPSTPVRKKDFVPVRLGSPAGTVRLLHPSGLVIECAAGTEISWLRSLLGLSDAS